MRFDADNLVARREAMVGAGHWRDVTINDLLDRAAKTRPDTPAVIAHLHDSGQETTLTYDELVATADRLAVGLHRSGVRRDDVVAVQLPNWWQFTVACIACARIGAVVNPLMHIFRERELAFMLAHGETTAAFIPTSFRGHDFPSMYDGLRNQLPALKTVITVNGSVPPLAQGNDGFSQMLATSGADEDGADDILTGDRPSPDDVTQLIYTSGTTGEPKGAMHSANTLFANVFAYVERLDLTDADVVLMASPMAHQTGFLYGLLCPILLGCPAVLLDVWDADRAVELVQRHGVSFTMGSTPFLSDLTDAVTADNQVDSLQLFVCAGAPIPPPLVERARPTLGAAIVSAWGMTENGAVTTTRRDDEPSRAAETDGSPMPGVEVRVVDEDGTDVGVEVEGRLQVRCCSNFGGYLKRPELNGTDDAGWFETGDLARLDDAGYVRIVGRSKDVIIRGGENIPVVEVEDLLYRHPAVAQAAIVAYPDDRLGERACAVVVTRPGEELTFDDMVTFLTDQRLAKNYFPERLEVLDEMPVTPSGKIQKFHLRDLIER